MAHFWAILITDIQAIISGSAPNRDRTECDPECLSAAVASARHARVQQPAAPHAHISAEIRSVAIWHLCVACWRSGSWLPCCWTGSPTAPMPSSHNFEKRSTRDGIALIRPCNGSLLSARCCLLADRL